MASENKNFRRVYGLIIVLAILQIGSLIFISVMFVKFDYKITDVKNELSDSFAKQLIDYDNRIREELGIINIAIASQESSFQDQIRKIKATQSDFSAVIEDSLKSVVAVVTDDSLGTGFFITDDGYVVTNEHVIDNNKYIQVYTYDKRRLNAELIGKDVTRDLALLKVNISSSELVLANSDNLDIGQKVIAIGNPLGLSFSVTEGIISALDRRGPNNLREYIQTDVSLNPGNSGGPLIDVTGEVVGINNFKIGEAESLGFALESNSIRESVNNIANQTIV